MCEREIYNLYSMCCALFQKTMPRQDAPAVTVLVETLSDIPDEVGEYLYAKFQELDSMPQNFTKACRGFYQTWLMENNRAIARDVCPTCKGVGGFECWQYSKVLDKITHFFAFCPTCAPRRKGFSYLTPEQWEARGIDVMPPGYPGGIRRYEKDKGLSIETPADKEAAALGMKSNAPKPRQSYNEILRQALKGKRFGGEA